MREWKQVIMNSGIDFDSVRVARVDDNWRYAERVHEYLRAPDDEWHDLYRPDPEVRVNVCEFANRHSRNSALPHAHVHAHTSE